MSRQTTFLLLEIRGVRFEVSLSAAPKARGIQSGPNLCGKVVLMKRVSRAPESYKNNGQETRSSGMGIG